MKWVTLKCSVQIVKKVLQLQTKLGHGWKDDMIWYVNPILNGTS